jgi:hypothetical protein
MGSPLALQTGTTMASRTVSIQKIAIILNAWALWLVGGLLLSPVRNAISAGPPAKPGDVGTGGAGGWDGLGGQVAEWGTGGTATAGIHCPNPAGTAELSSCHPVSNATVCTRGTYFEPYRCPNDKATASASVSRTTLVVVAFALPYATSRGQVHGRGLKIPQPQTAQGEWRSWRHGLCRG